MFIATSARPKDLAPLGAKPSGVAFAEVGKSDCAPAELRSKEGPLGYKHLAPPGRSRSVLLHFHLDSPMASVK